MTYFLGLTGGIATGKSTASNFFKKQGIPVIDSDLIAHQQLSKRDVIERLSQLFGNIILTSSGQIDRKKLGAIVFNDKNSLAKLNAELHPLICQQIKLKIAEYERIGCPFVVLDAPLLYELKLDKVCNAVLVISLNFELQKKRLKERNNLSDLEAEKRIYSQLPLEIKKNYANYVIASKVIDSRPSDENRSIRRRRECENCGYRFTTFERVEQTPLLVIKNDGTREPFNREKILRGVMMAAQKRPISSQQLDTLVDHVDNAVRKQGVSEISSKEIGEIVMDELANLDDVAYIRFASIYRQFTDVSGFMEAMTDMLKKQHGED